MNKNKFLIIGYNEKSDFVDINSEDFCVTYGNGFNGHGLQCYYEGGTERYEDIQCLLDDISNKVRRLHRLATEDLEELEREV